MELICFSENIIPAAPIYTYLNLLYSTIQQNTFFLTSLYAFNKIIYEKGKAVGSICKFLFVLYILCFITRQCTIEIFGMCGRYAFLVKGSCEKGSWKGELIGYFVCLQGHVYILRPLFYMGSFMIISKISIFLLHPLISVYHTIVS